MKERSKAEQLHADAIQAREKEQDFLKALQLSSEALIAYGEEGNSEGFAGIAGTMQNIYQHLYEQTENRDYLIFSLSTAEAAVKLADERDFAEKSLPYRDLAKANEKLGEYATAVENYQKALKFEDSPSLARPGVKSDIKAHLGFAMIMSGDKETGVSTLNEAIAELEADTEANKYEHDVWLSGAYMRKAGALKDTESFQKAKQIIDSNPELVLRKQQWEKLASEID